MMKKFEILNYIHSACCKGHWELVITDEQKFELICEKCGKPSGIEIASEPPSCATCEECGEDGKEHTEH